MTDSAVPVVTRQEELPSLPVEDRKKEHQLYLLKEFQVQLLRFVDELMEQFPHVAEFVIIRIFIKDQVSIYDLLGRFNRDLLPHKDQIRDRNEAFFLENSLFLTKGSVSEDRVNFFKDLWLSDRLDTTDRQIIWEWMDVFMQIGEKYEKAFGPVKGWEREKYEIPQEPPTHEENKGEPCS